MTRFRKNITTEWFEIEKAASGRPFCWGADTEQRILSLTDDDLAHLDKQRDWLMGHYESDPVPSFAGWGAKLVLIETILNSGWVLPDETWKLQSLGVAFGDALAEYMGVHWVAVEDEYGRDPALRDGRTGLKLFPLTMISKRVEAGEQVEPVDLFKGICRLIEEAREKITT